MSDAGMKSRRCLLGDAGLGFGAWCWEVGQWLSELLGWLPGPWREAVVASRKACIPKAFLNDGVLWVFPVETSAHLCSCWKCRRAGASFPPTSQGGVWRRLIPRLEWENWPVRNGGWAGDLSWLLLTQSAVSMLSFQSAIKQMLIRA